MILVAPKVSFRTKDVQVNVLSISKQVVFKADPKLSKIFVPIYEVSLS